MELNFFSKSVGAVIIFYGTGSGGAIPKITCTQNLPPSSAGTHVLSPSLGPCTLISYLPHLPYPPPIIINPPPLICTPLLTRYSLTKTFFKHFVSAYCSERSIYKHSCDSNKIKAQFVSCWYEITSCYGHYSQTQSYLYSTHVTNFYGFTTILVPWSCCRTMIMGLVHWLWLNISKPVRNCRTLVVCC